MLGGEKLVNATGLLIAGAANPLVDTIERLEAKLLAGVALLQTNIVYDVDRFAEWFEPMLAAGIAERAYVLVGVTPPRSTQMLRFLHDRIPGVEVNQATFARMEQVEGEAAKTEGIRVAADVSPLCESCVASRACTSWRRAGRPRLCRGWSRWAGLRTVRVTN